MRPVPSSCKLAALLVCFLCACKDAAPPVRTAASVNGAGISLSRFYAALAEAESTEAGATPKDVMNALIDQELLAQKAAAAGLDRKPSVVEALDAARTQILARSYVRRAQDRAPKISEPEARAYYEAHPELFRDRRVWRFFELTVTAAPEATAPIASQAAKSRSLTELAGWLRSHDFDFALGGAARPSEELPAQLLERLSSLDEGQLTLLPAPGGVSIVQLVQSVPAPLAMEDALPAIESHLGGRRTVELAEAELKVLREAAKVEYRFVPELWETRAGGAPAQQP